MKLWLQYTYITPRTSHKYTYPQTNFRGIYGANSALCCHSNALFFIVTVTSSILSDYALPHTEICDHNSAILTPLTQL